MGSSGMFIENALKIFWLNIYQILNNLMNLKVDIEALRREE